MNRNVTRRASLTALALLTGSLAGCAALSTLTADVSTFGDWPDGRGAGSYAFERLPSQQARAEQQDQLESLARDALEHAGFKPAAAGAQPEVLVQVGARITRYERSPWDDPLWWHGGFGYWRHGPWRGPYWSLGGRFDTPRSDREVALLLRDRASGKPLFEARASNVGVGADSPAVLGALFEAALADFPRLGVNPRSVTVPLR